MDDNPNSIQQRGFAKKMASHRNSKSYNFEKFQPVKIVNAPDHRAPNSLRTKPREENLPRKYHLHLSINGFQSLWDTIVI